MRVWAEPGELGARRRAAWLRPVCFALVLAMLPLPWSRHSGCGATRELTGVDLLFKDAEAGAFCAGVVIVALAAMALAPRLRPGLRLALDTAALAGTLLLSFIALLQIALGIVDSADPLPAGVVVLVAFGVATGEAFVRMSADVNDLWMKWRARRARGDPARPRAGPEEEHVP